MSRMVEPKRREKRREKGRKRMNCKMEEERGRRSIGGGGREQSDSWPKDRPSSGKAIDP